MQSNENFKLNYTISMTTKYNYSVASKKYLKIEQNSFSTLVSIICVVVVVINWNTKSNIRNSKNQINNISKSWHL